MWCKECGTELNDNQKFCSECGKSQESFSSESTNSNLSNINIPLITDKLKDGLNQILKNKSIYQLTTLGISAVTIILSFGKWLHVIGLDIFDGKGSGDINLRQAIKATSFLGKLVTVSGAIGISIALIAFYLIFIAMYLIPILHGLQCYRIINKKGIELIKNKGIKTSKTTITLCIIFVISIVVCNSYVSAGTLGIVGGIIDDIFSFKATVFIIIAINLCNVKFVIPKIQEQTENKEE